MIFAERTTALVVEALTFQVLLAVSAIEALAMIVMIQSLNPSIAGFNGETASETFRSEKLIPIGLTVSIAILKEERSISELLAAMAASEAFRMEVLADGIQAIALDFRTAFAASRSQIFLEAIFAVQVTLFFNETNVLQWTTAIGVDANEMIRAPNATQSSNERTSDVHVATIAQWHTYAWSDGLVVNTASTFWCGSSTECCTNFATSTSIKRIVAVDIVVVVVANIIRRCRATIMGHSGVFIRCEVLLWFAIVCRIIAAIFIAVMYMAALLTDIGTRQSSIGIARWWWIGNW